MEPQYISILSKLAAITVSQPEYWLVFKMKRTSGETYSGKGY